MHTDTQRARAIVRAASQQTKVRSVREWLFRDEHGTWERQACELLVERAADAERLGLSAEQFDAEISSYILFFALQSTLQHARKVNP